MLKQKLSNLLKQYIKTQSGSKYFFNVANTLITLPGDLSLDSQDNRYTKMLWQGITNQKYIPIHLHQIWPYWVYQQYHPESKAYQIQNNPFVANNVVCRNWSLLSFPKSDYMAIIDPKGLITPLPKTWSLDFWISNSKNIISPSQSQKVDQKMLLEHPSIITNYSMNKITCSSEVFYKCMSQDTQVVYNEVTITNTNEKAVDFSFYFAIRPYNPEGIAPISSIYYFSQNAFIINEQVGVVFDKKPDNIICSNYQDGDVSRIFNKWEMILKSTCQNHLASAVAEYKIHLEPNASTTLSCKLPIEALKHSSKSRPKKLSKNKIQLLNKQVAFLLKSTFDETKKGLSKDWAPFLKILCEIQVPDAKVQALFQRNSIQLMSHIGKTSLQLQSPIVHKIFKISDLYPVCMALDEMGHPELTESILTNLPLLKKDLFKLSKQLSPSEIGQLIFAIQHHYNYTKSLNFLDKVLPLVIPVIDRLVKKQLSKTQKKSESRLLPPSFSYDHSGEKESFIWDQYWGLYALQTTKSLVRLSSKKQIQSADYTKIQQQLKSELNNIFKLQASIHKEKIKFIVSPTHHFDARIIHTLISAYPLKIIAAHDPLVTETLTAIEDKLLIKGLYHSSYGTKGIPLFENLLLAHIYLSRHDEKAFKILNWVTENSSDIGTWPDAIHPNFSGGSDGDGQSPMASALFILLIKRMLVQEDGKILHLLPSIPIDWVNQQKQTIGIKNLQTTFGSLSFALKPLSKTEWQLNVSTHFHNPPQNIAITFPHSVQKVILDNHTLSPNSKLVTLPSKVTEAVFTLSTQTS